MNLSSNAILRGFNFFLAIVLTASFALAQQPGTGSLRGQITDEFGGIVIGATVTLVDAKGAEKTATTNDEGVYLFNNLAPGTYTVRALTTGFALYQSTGIQIAAGGRESLDIKLTITLENQDVTVSADTPVSTDSENNQSALVIKGTDLDALPDDPDDLAAALQALAGPSAGPEGGQIFIDGFTGGRIPPKESIREIRINQNPFSAEFDRLGFGRVEILTRPGTDKVRGQTFFNFGDEALNSRDPFAERRAPYQLRSYGGNLSGPIVKKKASFFLDFDRRETDGNSIINAQFIEPTTFNFVNVNRTLVIPRRNISFSPRVDYQLNTNNTLVARYRYSRSETDNLGVGDFSLDVDPFFNIDRTYSRKSADHTFQITETAILSPTVINETRFQYEHETFSSGGDISAPVIQVRDAFTGGGSGAGPVENRDTSYELQNYTSFSLGLHSLKAGARLRGVNITDISQQGFNGSYVFAGRAPITNAAGQVIQEGLSSVEQFRLFRQGVAGFLPSQLNVSGGNPEADVSQTDFSLFIQDDWRVRPNFTLSGGLRYETQTNISSNLNFAPRLAFAYSPGAAGARQPKTVIRGGFGIFYNRFGENFTLQANRFDGENQQQFIVTNPGTDEEIVKRLSLLQLPQAEFDQRLAQERARASVARSLLSGSANLSSVPSLDQLSQFAIPQTTRIVAADLQSPYTIQSTASIERLLPGRITMTASYVNTRTLHLLRTRNINAPLNGVRPLGESLGNVYQYESSGILNQNQFIINANTRFNPNFSIFANYTLGKANSNSDGAGSFPADNYDLSNEYGRSSFDVRHRFFLGGSISAPWGIRLNPLIFASTGAPFNITTGLDNNGDTLFTDRPAFATAATLPANLRVTPFGDFDVNPVPGTELIPRNYGQSPGQFTVNLRINKTFGFGTVPGSNRTAANGATAGGTAAAGGGDAPAAGGRGGGRGGQGGGGGGPRGGGGGGGPFGAGGIFGAAGRPEQKRYNVSLGINVNNILNRTNPGAFTGNLSSRFFGLSTQSGGGFRGGGGGGAAGNRSVEAQIRFSF